MFSPNIAIALGWLWRGEVASDLLTSDWAGRFVLVEVGECKSD